MPTREEAEAAADRVRKVGVLECSYSNEVLALAWLAEHDPTPITVAGLEAEGFANDYGTSIYRRGSVACTIAPHGQWWWYSKRSHDVSPPPLTMGQVRQLLARLEAKTTSREISPIS